MGGTLETKRRLRIGILGAGAMAAKHVESLRGSAVAEIAGVAGASPESLARFSAARGIEAFASREALFESCDAVDVCLPTFAHRDAVLAAAGAGLHVVCEKPIALDVKSAREMKAACDSAGALFMVAHCLRFMPQYAYLKNSVVAGSHGAPLVFTAWRFGPVPGSSSGAWMLDYKLSGGPAIDLQIHDADMIQYLFGMPLYARATGAESENVRTVSAGFEFENGPSARAEAGWHLKKGYSFRAGFRAVFEDAVFEYHSDCSPSLKVFRDGCEPMDPALPETNPYRMELEYFATCALSGEAPERSSAEEATKALAISLAVRRSTKSAGKKQRVQI